MSDVKPCPFCGSKNIIITTVDDESKSSCDSVECGECLIQGIGWTVDDWNKRATHSNSDGSNDTL